MGTNNERTFTFVNNRVLEESIRTAVHHIIYAAPSVSESVANAICTVKVSCPEISVRVVVDADAEAFRLGFGEHAGLKLVCESGLDVRYAPGLRIAILVVDDRAWVYAPTPEIIIEQADETISNAVEVNVEFARQILLAIAPDVRVVNDEEILDADILPIETVPEIGIEKVEFGVLKKIEEELKENPPQKFDSARKVRVYQGYLQFVELSFKGCRLNGHKIKIPNNLLNVADKDLRERITTTCNMIADRGRFSTKLQMIEYRVRDLRTRYLRSLGERYGTVILKRERTEFDKKLLTLMEELEALQKTIVDDLKTEIIDNRLKLIEMLVTGLKETPPDELKVSGGNELDEEWAREYIEEILARQTPPAEKLIAGMQLTCDYKDVTFEMLADDDFKKLVAVKFPDEKFIKLYSEENTIAEKKTPTLNFGS